MLINDNLTRINLNLEHLRNLVNMVIDIQSRTPPTPLIDTIMTTILADITPVPSITHNTIMTSTVIDIIAETDATEQCSICRDNYTELTITRKINRCGHYFHYGCLDTWLLNHATCPNCRTDIIS
jgi:hypothetical protein